MSKLVSPSVEAVRPYSAPNLTVYGAVTKLTANGSTVSLESNGGTCGTGTKVRC